MSTKNFTFDPESGVPNAADLVIYGGANFKNTFNVDNTSNENYVNFRMRMSARHARELAPSATCTI